MSRLLPALAAPLMISTASSALAAPLEAPLTNQAAVLSYEIEVTGTSGGKPLRQRLLVETPVFARASGAVNLFDGFTDAQNEEIAAMSAATTSEGDSTADMLEINRKVEEMGAACGAGESPSCAAARERYQAAEQRLAVRGARIAEAQTAVVRRDEDDHRFLTFAAGEMSTDCGIVRYEHQLGERKASGAFPDPKLPYSGELACQTMAVLDRRDGALALQMSPATIGLSDGTQVIDLLRLVSAPGLKLGALHISLTLPPQPTAGAAADYVGSKSLEAGGLRYTFRWKLRRK